MASTSRWVLLVAYDGAPFRGFAFQPGQPTVAGALAAALRRTARLGDELPIVCAGRTDAGVHARGQVVHVDLPDPLPDVRQHGGGMGPLTTGQLCRSLNRQLSPRVVVRHACPAPPHFDARRSALGRTYRYMIWNASRPDPLLAPSVWHVEDLLDVRAMAGAADACIGEHDFRAFCRRPPGTSPTDPVCRQVTRAEWREVSPLPAALGDGHLLRFEVTARSFCHQMVRSLVAFQVDAGRRRRTAADLVERLRSGDRAGLPAPAPAGGLCLESVDYGPGLLQVGLEP